MVCAPRMEASNSWSPCGMWQVEHSTSLNCGPPGGFAPVAKFTLSWQDPHAAAVGLIRYALDCVAVGVWQIVQLRTSDGNTTVEKLLTEFSKPMISYVPPATTLGRLDPM